MVDYPKNKCYLTQIKSLTASLWYYFRDFGSHLTEIYKGLTKNPRWLLMRYFCRLETYRSWMVSFAQSPQSSSVDSANDGTFSSNFTINSVVETLQAEGLYLGINLASEICQEIIDFALSTPCYGNRKPQFGFYYPQREAAQLICPKPILTGYYFNSEQCPAIARLSHHPQLRALAAHYFQAEPQLIGIQLWWSFATEAPAYERLRAAQVFHYDMDDCRSLKFFFYLTDVDAASGPHVCVRGSHKRKTWRHQLIRRGYSDLAVVRNYGQDNLITICGEAGYGFVEDPLCFHKGIPPTQRDRLILQIEFAIHDYKMQNDLKDSFVLELCVPRVK